MDAVLQRHCARYIYAVPEGLRELMSDISREVLRTQPEQLYTFIADYLDALLITRENARVAARLLEVIMEIGLTIVEFLTRTGLTRAEADRIVTIIQAAFRNHMDKKKHMKLEQETEDEERDFLEGVTEAIDVADEYVSAAAIIIQKAYRQFKEREAREKDLLRGMVDWRVAARATINLYRRTGVTFAEANRAATLIKAAYKGYYTRRVMRRLLEQGTKEYVESLIELPDYEVPEFAEEEEEWGWCFCALDDQTESTVTTPPVTEEVSSATTVVGSVMTSLLKSVVPSLELIEEPIGVTPAETEVQVQRSVTIQEPAKDTVQEVAKTEEVVESQEVGETQQAVKDSEQGATEETTQEAAKGPEQGAAEETTQAVAGETTQETTEVAVQDTATQEAAGDETKPETVETQDPIKEVVEEPTPASDQPAEENAEKLEDSPPANE